MKQRIVIMIEGGIIQQVIASDPDNLEVIVVDHDTDSVDKERLIKMDKPGEVAIVEKMAVDTAPGFVSWLFDAHRE